MATSVHLCLKKQGYGPHSNVNSRSRNLNFENTFIDYRGVKLIHTTTMMGFKRSTSSKPFQLLKNRHIRTDQSSKLILCSKMAKEDSISSIDVSSLTDLIHFSQTPKVDADQTKEIIRHKRKQPENSVNEIRSSALKRAQEVQVNLDPQFPNFVKNMLHSHVSSCFWLGIPLKFCKSYLPQEDETITLVAENGEQYPVKFLARKTGLSGGWRGFSLLHNLVEGDVLVFQLIMATKFKVYIIRAHDFADVDGALVFLDLDARAKQSDLGKDPVTSKTFSRKPPRCVPLPICNKGSSRSSSPSATCLDLALPTDQTGNVSEEVDSGVGEPIKLLESIVELKELKHLDSFTIVVNGLVMDSDINKYVKAKYYELCCSQNAFLHDHLPKVIGSKLVAGIISETVNIADAIAAGKLTTPHEEFSIWDRSLMAFEQLGMNVGFLRSRLQRLVRLAYESKQAIDAKRCDQALIRQTQQQSPIFNS